MEIQLNGTVFAKHIHKAWVLGFFWDRICSTGIHYVDQAGLKSTET